jgi:ABC-type multidrug transport system fused ATPase/permease subunit
MKDGQIVESGSYRDLIACPDKSLVQLMAAHKETLKHIPSEEVDDSLSCNSRPCPKNLIEIDEQNCQEIAKDEKRTREEESMTGRVKWSVYSTFVTLAYKGALVPVILLCQILFQAMQMGSNYWISWAAEQRSRNNNGRLIGIFSLLSGGSSIFILGRTVLMTIVSVETARRLYHGMTTSVFRAPISFFDNTPSSRILSRVSFTSILYLMILLFSVLFKLLQLFSFLLLQSSTDQTRADSDIPYRLAGLVFALIQLLSIIVLMSHAAWQVLLVFFAVFAISIWYQVRAVKHWKFVKTFLNASVNHLLLDTAFLYVNLLLFQF